MPLMTTSVCGLHKEKSHSYRMLRSSPDHRSARQRRQPAAAAAPEHTFRRPESQTGWGFRYDQHMFTSLFVHAEGESAFNASKFLKVHDSPSMAPACNGVR